MSVLLWCFQSPVQQGTAGAGSASVPVSGTARPAWPGHKRTRLGRRSQQLTGGLQPGRGPPTLGGFLRGKERVSSAARASPRAGAEAARPGRRWSPGEGRGPALISPSWLERPLCTAHFHYYYYRVFLLGLSASVGAGAARAELQRAVWERESPAKMALPPPLAAAGARGRRRPSPGGCGAEQRAARPEPERWTSARAVRSSGFFGTLKRILPAGSFCAGLQRGGSGTDRAKFRSPRFWFETCEVLGGV